MIFFKVLIIPLHSRLKETEFKLVSLQTSVPIEFFVLILCEKFTIDFLNHKPDSKCSI